MLGSLSRLPVVTRCACCERGLLKSEVVFYSGYFRSVMSRYFVEVIAVCICGIYGNLDRDTLRRGRDLRARSMWYVRLAAWLKI